MKRTLAAGAALAAALGAGAAADETCGAQTHMRWGETRAYHGDWLASCRADGSCVAVTHRMDDRAPIGWSHQARLTRASDAAPTELSFVAVTNYADPAQGFIIEVGAHSTEIGAGIDSPGAVNEYRISDPAVAAPIIAQMRAGRFLTWFYISETEQIPASPAEFSLRGVTAALDWIDCMQGG